MAPKTVRLGLVGAGGFTRTMHLPNFLKMPGVQVTAVANRTMESGEKIAKEFNIPKVFTDWRQVVKQPDVDAVIVGTWPSLHAPVAVAALEAGKHVFVEVHVWDLAGARAMHQAAKERPHLKTMMSNIPVKGDAMMRKLLAEGYVGDVYQVLDYRLNGRYADPKAPLHWRQSREYSGINFQLIALWFEINRRWFGEHKRLIAQAKTFIPRGKNGTTDGQLPDSMHVLAELENGALISYLQSGVTQFGGRARIEVYGSKGTLVYHHTPAEIYGAQMGEQDLHPIPIPPEMESKWPIQHDFIKMIQEDAKPSPELVSFEDALKYTEFNAACALSLTTGGWINLPLP